MNRSVVLGANERMWFPGHSPVSGGVGQLERQMEVLAGLVAPPPRIGLHFRVPSYTRRGHFFDMESLGYVILATWRHDLAKTRLVKLSDPYRPDSIWLTTVATEQEPGLFVSHETPPEPSDDSVRLNVDIAAPPTVSVRGTVLPEIAECSVLDDGTWLGLELCFGSKVDIGEFGFYGPVKPLIDAMGPYSGRTAGAGLPITGCTTSEYVKSIGAMEGSASASGMSRTEKVSLVRTTGASERPRQSARATPDHESATTGGTSLAPRCHRSGTERGLSRVAAAA